MPARSATLQKIDSHPAFQPRNKRGPWIFKLAEPFQISTPWQGFAFKSEWLDIREDGLLTVPVNYVWDGCSIKRSLFDLWIIGTPDGVIDIDTMKPRTYFASCVHDAMYQYYGYHGVPRKEIDLWFRHMMQEAKFGPAPLYYAMVRLLGGAASSGQTLVRQDGGEYFKSWLDGRE